MRFNGYLKSVEFYSDLHDPTVTYAEFIVPPMGGSSASRRMFVDIDDASLKAYIRQCVIPASNKKLNELALIQEIKDNLILIGNSDRVAPRVRTAGKLSKQLVEYDLNNTDFEYVKITPTGWHISPKHKYKFLKRNTLASQVTPQQTDTNLLTLLRPLMNVEEEDLILIASWLVQAFCMGNHHALLLMATQGGGKSTLTKMIRRILDPSPLGASVMPTKKDDLFAILSNSYFVAFDNLGDELSKDFSDILCSAVTGATVAKRKLYTTNELGVYELHSSLVLNGIDIVPAESDLASRCLLIKLKALDEKSRKTDSELENIFQSSLPEILGAIFNALATAMSIIDKIKITRKPRMFEAYKDMLAIALALGVPQSEFERIYFDNLKAMDKERASVAVVEAVHEYMTKQAKGRAIEGRVSDLKEKIYANYSGSINDLPRSASLFSRKLKRETHALAAAGYTANFDNTYVDGTHLKIIKN